MSGGARLAILGAGCAGLSLAREVIERDGRARVVLFDRREGFERDRTWCGWAVPGVRYEECVTRRWAQWSLRGPRGEVRVSCPSMPYRHIPADAYYERVLSLLRGSGRCEVRLGAPVDGVEPSAGGVTVRWGGAEERFDHAFDSRPARPPGGGLVQHFAGQEVETDRDAFDPEAVTLMDFDVAQDRGAHFFYVLPFTARRALVEPTFMTATVEPTDYQRRIGDYLRERFGLRAWRVVREERGRIPMAPSAGRAAEHPRLWRIGTGAGVVKPSTGYAFDAIHRDCARVADAWASGRPRPALPRTPVASWLDRLMVTFLRRHPRRAATLFPDLFRRCDPERIVRFLSDRGGWRDTLQVVGAAPRLPMALHCVRTLGGFA